MSRKGPRPIPEFGPEFCYFLGFVWGDGYLYKHLKPANHRVVLENAAEDLDLLLPMFKNLYNFSLFRRKRADHWKDILRATAYDKNLYYFLMDNGYDVKTNPHNIVTIMPENLQSYFWLGLFDADGSIGLYKRKNGSTDCVSSISSHVYQKWDNLAIFCDKNKIDYTFLRVTKKMGSNSCLVIRRIKSLHNLKDSFYKNYDVTPIGLPRKRDKFLLLPEVTNQMNDYGENIPEDLLTWYHN